MSTTPAPEATETQEKTKTGAIVDAVVDAVRTWADVGLGYVKASLTASARAIDRTAESLDTVRERLRA